MKTYGTFLMALLCIVLLWYVYLANTSLRECKSSFVRLYADHLKLKSEAAEPIRVEIHRDEKGRLWLMVGTAVSEITQVCGIRT